MTNPIQRATEQVQRALTATPDEIEALRRTATEVSERRFAQGGYITHLGPAAPPDCDHHWTFHLKGGEPLSIGVCTLCGEPNWEDLRRQLSELDVRYITSPGEA